MTIGELARFFNDQFATDAPLEVIEMEGWSRSMYGDATGLPFVMPSPNIPTLRIREVAGVAAPVGVVARLHQVALRQAEYVAIEARGALPNR